MKMFMSNYKSDPMYLEILENCNGDEVLATLMCEEIIAVANNEKAYFERLYDTLEREE